MLQHAGAVQACSYLAELFDALDADRSGEITRDEWTKAIREYPNLLSPHTIDGILRLGVLVRQLEA